ncbi:MAG: Asp-tRNA(Asn)/Glu-tRNA(Gln) amidotransferase subunit GatC [Gemmataceae bacterium]|nr:Asp-tRNA(Asn)/Glu-tRNA(Gln) amidotransferase subunit GatC [Gemmataceae bacterium]
MALNQEQVQWIAHLGRLELKQEELASSAKHLSAILEYINLLQQVDTSDVLPLTHAIDMANVFRPDELKPSLGVQDALANAPDRKGDLFGVPPVLD